MLTANDRTRLQGILDRSGVDIGRRREAYRRAAGTSLTKSRSPTRPTRFGASASNMDSLPLATERG